MITRSVISVLAGLLLAATTALASVPAYDIYVDFQQSDQPFDIKGVFTGNTPTLRFHIQDDQTAFTNLTAGYTALFRYGANRDTASMLTLTGSINIAGGYIDFIGKTNSFPKAGDSYLAELILTGTNLLTWGQGTMRVIKSPGTGSVGGLDLRTIINWDLITSIGTTPWAAGTEPLFVGWLATNTMAESNTVWSYFLPLSYTNWATNSFLPLASTNTYATTNWVTNAFLPLASTNAYATTNWVTNAFLPLASTNAYATTNWSTNTFLPLTTTNTFATTNWATNVFLPKTATNAYAATNWVTNAFLPLASTNAYASTNWVTNTFLPLTETNAYASTNWAATNLYNINNPSNFVNASITNGLAGMNWVTNAFYPIGNPSNFVDHATVTNWATNTFYPNSNPSNFASYSVTNWVTNTFYTANNPSGYVSSATLTGAVFKLLEGPDIDLSPSNGMGNVTVGVSTNISAKVEAAWDHVNTYDTVIELEDGTNTLVENSGGTNRVHVSFDMMTNFSLYPLKTNLNAAGWGITNVSTNSIIFINGTVLNPAWMELIGSLASNVLSAGSFVEISNRVNTVSALVENVKSGANVVSATVDNVISGGVITSNRAAGWAGVSNAVAMTNDQRAINLREGTFSNLYRSSEQSTFATNEFVTLDELNRQISSLSGVTDFGDTNAHPAGFGWVQFTNNAPATWTNSYVLASGTNVVGNRYETNAIAGGLNSGWYHYAVYQNVTLAGSAVYHSELVISDGTTTNVIAPWTSVTPTTTILPQESSSYLSTNMDVPVGGPWYLGVVRYAVRSGGAVTLNIYGGTLYPTHLEYGSRDFGGNGGGGIGSETQTVAGAAYVVVVTSANSFAISTNGLVSYTTYFETNASITARIEALESAPPGGIGSETQTVGGAAYVVVVTADNDFVVSTTGLVDYISYYETNASITARIEALESAPGGGAAQSPWTNNPDAAGFSLTNATSIIFSNGAYIDVVNPPALGGMRVVSDGFTLADVLGNPLLSVYTNPSTDIAFSLPLLFASGKYLDLNGGPITNAVYPGIETNIHVAGANITFTTNAGDGVVTIAGSAGGGGGVTNIVPGSGISVTTNSPTDMTIALSGSSGTTNLSVTVYARATGGTNTTLYGATMNTNFITVVGGWCGPNQPNQLATLQVLNADTTQFQWRIMSSAGIESTQTWDARFLVSQNGVQGGVTNYTVPWYRNPTLWSASALMQCRTNSAAGAVTLVDGSLEVGGQYAGRGLSCSTTSSVQDGVIRVTFSPDANASAWTTNGITLNYWGFGSTNDNKFDCRLWDANTGTNIVSWSNVMLVATGVVETLAMKTTNWVNTAVLSRYTMEIVQYLFCSNAVSNNAIFFIDATGSFQ